MFTTPNLTTLKKFHAILLSLCFQPVPIRQANTHFMLQMWDECCNEMFRTMWS